MYRIKSKKVSRSSSVTGAVIDMYDFDAWTIPKSAKDETSNSTKTIDANPHRI
jgi:hypothetical protein